MGSMHRSAHDLAAEWQGHNVHYAFTKSESSKHVDLDFDFKTNKWYTKVGTIFFRIIGET